MRQDIVVDVEATGVVTPINPVQVKSKASGTVLKIFVESGSQVKTGALLVKIDPRIPQNSYDQAAASVKAAEANVAVTKTQLLRDSSLFKNGVLTTTDMEAAQLAYANAASQLVGARTNLDNASIALEDVTIRAPASGTVIERDVSEGQVIASATGNVSGGTTLLVMANLAQIMDSTLVAESDIGNVKVGQSATIKVDAYPNRTFHGTVQKISPQATVQQSVTMFPVFIKIDNQDGALMPGMNSDVSILVEQQDNALAVPNDAVRSPRDARAAAQALGLDVNAVMASLGGGRRNGDSAGSSAAVSVSQPQCDSINAVLAAHPAAQKQMKTLRDSMMAGGDRAALGAQDARGVRHAAHRRRLGACLRAAPPHERRRHAAGDGRRRRNDSRQHQAAAGTRLRPAERHLRPQDPHARRRQLRRDPGAERARRGRQGGPHQRRDAPGGAPEPAGAHPEPHGAAGREPVGECVHHQGRRRTGRRPEGRHARGGCDARGGASGRAAGPAPGESVT